MCPFLHNFFFIHCVKFKQNQRNRGIVLFLSFAVSSKIIQNFEHLTSNKFNLYLHKKKSSLMTTLDVIVFEIILARLLFKYAKKT